MAKKKGLTPKQWKHINKTIDKIFDFGKPGDILLTTCNLGGKTLIGIHKKGKIKDA